MENYPLGPGPTEKRSGNRYKRKRYYNEVLLYIIGTSIYVCSSIKKCFYVVRANTFFALFTHVPGRFVQLFFEHSWNLVFRVMRENSKWEEM